MCFILNRSCSMALFKFILVLTTYILYVYCRRLPITSLNQIRDEILLTKDNVEGYESEPINGRELSSVEHSEAGLVSGIATRMIIQPLDVLKIRFQLQEEPIGGANSGKYKSVIQSVRLILREESAVAFWKGHVPAQGLSAAYGLVQFASFEWLTREVGSHFSPEVMNKFHSPIDFACGSIAGCLAMTAAMPLDVIRTRLVAQGHQSVVYKGTLDALPHIWRTEGFKGYFRGWVPGLIQVAPFTGLQFTMYNAFYKLWNKIVIDHENYGALVAGAASGTVAKTVLYPLDMVRHRLQVNGFKRSGFGKQTQHDRRMIRSMLFILKTESIYGLFKGLLPSQLKAAASSGCAFLFYEIFCDILRARN